MELSPLSMEHVFGADSVPILSARETRRPCAAVSKIASHNIEREPRTVIHVKRAKLFDPMG